MSNLNGYPSNSLFALEQSLFGTLPPPSQTFAAAETGETEEAEELERQQAEAYAFDWDEPIELSYEEEAEETDSDSQSMSWQNSGDTEAEDEEADAFAIAEEPDEEDIDPLAQSNSLFALEQSLLGNFSATAPAMQFSFEDLEESEEGQTQPVEAQAFDWDEAIQLEYEGSAYPTAESFDWLPTDDSRYSSGLNQPPTYEVEAFEVVDEPETAATEEPYPGSTAYGFADEPTSGYADQASYEGQLSDENHAYGFDANHTRCEPTTQTHQPSEAVPVHATVANPPSPPHKSAEPVDAEAFDFDALEQAPVRDRSADAEAFAADLDAILRGEKVYEAPIQTSPPAPPSQVQAASQSPAPSAPVKLSTAHDVFDQMGRSMTHATAFDLGTFSLEQQFDEFDRLLDDQESEALAESEASVHPPEPKTSEPKTSEIQNMGETSETAQSFMLDEDEVIADVEALSVDEPWQAVQFQLENNDIASLLENVPPNQNELKDKYLLRLKQEAKKRYGKKYQSSVDDPNISAAVNALWQKASAPKVTADELKNRYWHHISIGGSNADPDALTGYHWSGYENGNAKFTRIGKPTKPADQFGVYQQKVQQRGTGKSKKDASTFFPDAWTEQHFDSLFSHFAQRKDFNPDKGGTYSIDAAINGDAQYIGMPILFMPNEQGEGSCIPVWTEPKRGKAFGEEMSSFPSAEAYAASADGETEVDETSFPDKEIYTALGLSDTDATEAEDRLYPPELEMEQLLSGSLEYSNAQVFFVAAAPSTLPAKQVLTVQYQTNQRLLTPAEVTEIQRLSTGGAAAGPAGTKALTDRGLMDYPAMVNYAVGNNFNNWETLPKPTRLQVATYQWNNHNPGGGVDMSNKPGYWKARSVDANSNPPSATAATSRQAIYDRDRDIWIATLSVPSQAAIGRIPPGNALALLNLDTSVRQILQRVFALLHLNLQYRDGANPYQAWIQHVAVALSHGGRVNVKIPQNTGDNLLDWIFVNNVVKTNAQVGTRSSSTHNIKVTTGGQFQEKKELFKFVGMTHYGINLAVGGIGNLDVNGNPILPNGSYGHLYIGYRKPEANKMGGMLIGVENDEYGRTNPLGHVHNLKATEAEMSPTGGLKLDRIGRPGGAGDQGFMLVDLTAVANLHAKLANVQTKLATANAGGDPTIQAMAQRLAGAIDPTLFT